MNATVKSVRPSRRENVLAEVILEIADGDEVITIDNARILRNKQGNLWLAMPSYSVPLPGARGYEYLPVVVVTKELRRQAEDAALEAYERWRKSEGAPAKAGERNIHGIVAADEDVGF
jgi:hypothetical protein